MNDGGAVLVNHRNDDHVGVVERARVDDDRVGRAVIRFGKSERAEEIWQDVVDGIRRHISVGAQILGSIEREEDGDKVIMHVNKWAPTEISIVATPADTNVGIGRSAEPATEQTPQGVTMTTAAEKTDTAVDRERDKQIERDIAQRLNEIYAIGREFNCPELASEYATTGKTSPAEIIELNRKAFEHWKAAQEAEIERQEKTPDDPVTAIGLSDKEIERFSVSRALTAFLERDWKSAGFEKACNDEIVRILDREARGVFIPFEIQQRQRGDIKREMTTGGSGTGAEYVGTRLDPGNFIEQLRVTVQAIRLGARMLPGLRQNLDIPRKNSGADFAWLPEGESVTLSDLGTGVVSLTPKTIGGGVQSSRRMLKQSTPAIDDLVMSDLGEGAAEAIDLGAIQGSGVANQPTGIVNQTGVNTQVVNPAGQPTWAEVVGFETAVAADNALRGSLGWALTSTIVGYLKTTEKAASTGRFIMDNEGGMFGGTNNTLNGYPVGVQNALTAGSMIFGNWAELLIGMWGVLDLRPDPYTEAGSDALIIRAFQDIDIALRHGESFCKNVLV